VTTPMRDRPVRAIPRDENGKPDPTQLRIGGVYWAPNAEGRSEPREWTGRIFARIER
jgi:hypothetical protein